MSGRVSTLSCVLLLAAPASLWGGPLNKKLVGADATWVMHVDVEAAVSSSIGRLLAQDAEVKAGLSELRAECGVDLLKDVKGITLWGVEDAEEDCIAVVQTTSVVDELLEKFREEAGIEEVEEGGYELLKWSDGGETQYGHIRRMRQGDDRVVFIARSAADLVRGLEVADGERPSAAADGAVVKDSPGEHAIVFVSIPEISTLIPGHAEEHLPAFFDKITGVRFETGEQGDDLVAEGAVTAATSEDAAMVQQIAQGALAACKFACYSEPEMKDFVRFADAIKIEADDRTVRFSVRCNAADVRKALEQAHARQHQDRDDGREERDAGEDKDEDSPVAAPEKPRRKKGD